MSGIKEHSLENYIEGESDFIGVFIQKIGNEIHFLNMGGYGQLDDDSKTILDLETGIMTHINSQGEELIINYKEK